MLVGDLVGATVVAGDDLTTVAPKPNVLSEFGVAATRTLAADEALPMQAVVIDASVVRAEERIADGVGALAALKSFLTLSRGIRVGIG